MKFKQLPAWAKGGILAQFFPILLSILLLLNIWVLPTMLLNMPMMGLEQLLAQKNNTGVFYTCEYLIICTPNMLGWITLYIAYFGIGALVASLFASIKPFFRKIFKKS